MCRLPSEVNSGNVESRRVTGKEVACFCAAASALLAFLFRDAWVRDLVLGQAGLLYDFLPWQSDQPAGHGVRNRLLNDIPTVFYPFVYYARSAVLDGRFPLWTSQMGGGQPFFAAFQTAVLSPFTAFHYLLPFPASLTFDAAARLLVGGVGMYVFLRGWPLCRAAAAFGGVAYLLNSFSIVWLEHPLSAVAAWVPWLLLAVERCVARAERRAVAGLALTTALTVLSGHPETAFKVFLLAGLYAVYRGAVCRRVVRSTVLVLAAMLLGVLMCAIQILPFLEYVRESRTLFARGQAAGPMFTSPPAAFAAAFVPDFYGTPLGRRFVLGGTNYCEMSIYPGMAAWVFAAVGVLHPRHRGRAVFFLATGALAALIMYGTPVARVATFLLPPLRVAALSRFGLIGIVGVIIAAAVGVDALCRRDADSSNPRRSAIAAACAGIVVACLIAAFLLAERQLLESTLQWRSTVEAVRFALVLLVLSVATVFVWPRWHRWIVAALPVAILSVDLLSFADGFHPMIPRRDVFPDVPALQIPRHDEGTFRVAGWIDTLLPNTALVYGLTDVRSYDGIGIRHYSELLDIAFRFNGSTHQLVDTATPHLLDLLNVKYVLTPASVELPGDRFELVLEGPTRVFLNRRAQARAFLADEHVVLSGNAARRSMRDRPGLTTLAVLDRELAPALQPEHRAGDIGRADVRRYEDEHVSIWTRADGRRLLVLTDVYYPGWIATIDGVEAPIHRVDYAFRGVSVPAGDHLVEFTYRPSSFRYGAYGSMVGAAIVGFLFGGGAVTTGFRKARISSPRRM